MRQFLERRYLAAERINHANITELIGLLPNGKLCDLGCGDGEWTAELATRCGLPEVYGLELVTSQVEKARARGIRVAVSDLSERFPFADEQMDVVHANQVIEHVPDLDHFMSESRRILRVGGLLVLSTENASSWHNIFAALMGWQIFSATNISRRAQGLGNPLALHRRNIPPEHFSPHRTVLNFQGFRELAEAHELRVVAIMGAGYHPLPPTIGRHDPRHAHFLALKAIKDR